MPPARVLGVCVLLALATACASAAPPVPFADPSEIAGTWRGRVTGRSGHAMATMTVSRTGAFTGAMYLEGEDRDFSGAITVVRPGFAQYRGSQGFGTVVLREEGGQRTLRFLPDGGGVASVFTPSPSPR